MKAPSSPASDLLFVLLQGTLPCELRSGRRCLSALHSQPPLCKAVNTLLKPGVRPDKQLIFDKAVYQVIGYP